MIEIVFKEEDKKSIAYDLENVISKKQMILGI